MSGPEVHPLTLNKVGKDINALIKQGESVPESFFSYWEIIRDLLEQAEKGREGARLLALNEDFLKNSRSQALKSETKLLVNRQSQPSSIINALVPKDSLPSPLSPQITLDSRKGATARPPVIPKRIYPILYKELSDEPLDPVYRPKMLSDDIVSPWIGGR